MSIQRKIESILVTMALNGISSIKEDRCAYSLTHTLSESEFDKTIKTIKIHHNLKSQFNDSCPTNIDDEWGYYLQPVDSKEYDEEDDFCMMITMREIVWI
jgi:hypothetical protein